MIDWLGPFNEDEATARDSARLRERMVEDGRVKLVGVESWALRKGVETVESIAPHLDVVGSHFWMIARVIIPSRGRSGPPCGNVW